MTSVEVPTCHVCEQLPATAGGLSCAHQFCSECFRRYVTGSVLELNTSLRCCACGRISDLIVETGGGKPVVTFGRLGDTKLIQPVGVAQYSQGDYVIVDKHTKRVNIFKQNGRLCNDFAYIYNTVPARGAVVTSSGDIAIPFSDATYDFVSYFTRQGAFMGSSYISAPKNRPNIQGIACDTERNLIYLTDQRNSCIHVININTKVQSNRIQLDPIQFEVLPEPKGITVAPTTGDIYITDTANHCVKVYSPDGAFSKKIGCFGERPVQFNCPSGVAITAEGEMVVADRGNQRVQYLDEQGKFVRYVVCFKAGYDVYMAPDDVVTSGSGDIAVMMTSLKQADVGGIRVYR